MDSDFGDVRYSKAYAYEQLGQYEKAISEYREICNWLQHRGADAGEARWPEEKIRALSLQLKNSNTQ